MEFAKASRVNRRVDCGRGYLRVPQKLADRSKVGAFVDQMSGECMAQQVRRDILGDPRYLAQAP